MVLQLTTEQQERIEALPKEREYDNAAEYVLALVEADEEENDFIDDPKEAAIDLEEQFREAWHDAMTGNTRPAREALDEIRRKFEHDGK